MKKILFFFIFLFLTFNVSFSQELEFSVVSDSCVYIDIKNKKQKTESISFFQKAVDKINSSKSEFTLFLGNNINNPNKHNLVVLSKMLKKLDEPFYTLVGDKDVSSTKGLNKKEYYRILNLFTKNRTKNQPETKEIDGIIFVFLDGVNEFMPSANGYYKEEQIYPSNSIKESALPYNIKEMQKIISTHNNVIATITGHHNIEDEYLYGNIYNITTSSLSKDGEYKRIVLDYDKKTKKAIFKTRIYSVK